MRTDVGLPNLMRGGPEPALSLSNGYLPRYVLFGAVGQETPRLRSG